LRRDRVGTREEAQGIRSAPTASAAITKDFRFFSAWWWDGSGPGYTWRTGLAEINWVLPESAAVKPPPRYSPVWLDLYYKRLGAYGSQHPGGANAAFADGSVRFLTNSTPLLTIRGLSTRAGGEVVQLD
jgi:prepilin-type processing-associated H-X9-DG protein